MKNYQDKVDIKKKDIKLEKKNYNQHEFSSLTEGSSFVMLNSRGTCDSPSILIE